MICIGILTNISYMLLVYILLFLYTELFCICIMEKMVNLLRKILSSYLLGYQWSYDKYLFVH